MIKKGSWVKSITGSFYCVLEIHKQRQRMSVVLYSHGKVKFVETYCPEDKRHIVKEDEVPKNILEHFNSGVWILYEKYKEFEF